MTDETREEDGMVEDIRALPKDLANINLELDPESKVRVVALMMAIRYNKDQTITDAQYLQTVLNNENRVGPLLKTDPERPHNRVMQYAADFADFIMQGRMQVEMGTKYGPMKMILDPDIVDQMLEEDIIKPDPEQGAKE